MKVLSRTLLALLVALLWLPLLAQAQNQTAAPSVPPEVAQALPEGRLQGQGRLRFLGLGIYDARLWAAGGALSPQAWADRPLALELQYLRHLKGPLIAERSLTEMRRQGPISATQEQAWLKTLQSLIPDVQEGDRLVGHWHPEQGVRLFFNGQLRGAFQDLQLSRWFMGIWLSEQTSEPRLRDALFGRP